MYARIVFRARVEAIHGIPAHMIQLDKVKNKQLIMDVAMFHQIDAPRSLGFSYVGLTGTPVNVRFMPSGVTRLFDVPGAGETFISIGSHITLFYCSFC